MSRHVHKVIKPCFIGDVYRTEDRHSKVITQEPYFKPKADPEEEAKMDRGDLLRLPTALEPLTYGFDDDGFPVVGEADTVDVPEEDPINATDDAIALADEYGIEIDSIDGSGKEGRVTKGDVKKIVDSLDA